MARSAKDVKFARTITDSQHASLKQKIEASEVLSWPGIVRDVFEWQETDDVHKQIGDLEQLYQHTEFRIACRSTREGVVSCHQVARHVQSSTGA